MLSQNPKYSAVTKASAIGTLLQVLMVVTGHLVAAVALLFGPLGMFISLVAGWLYTQWGKPEKKGTAAGCGAVAGAVCAFLGILVSFLLGDVPASLLALGTLSSAVTGALGGFLAIFFRRRSAVRA